MIWLLRDLWSANEAVHQQKSTVKSRRKPAVKRREDTRPSLEYTTRGFSVRAGRLVLPKGVSIPVVWSRDLPSGPKSVRVCQDCLGHWYASFVVRRQAQAAKLHKKAARQNTHAARVWAKRVADGHQVIAVEDFKPKFLARSTMARKAADAAIGAAKRELIERGMRAGRTVVLVPPAYTTMTCPECGTRAKERPGLAERVFRCESCGHTAGRDRNAARVILAMAERGHAGADDVRHSLASFQVAGGVRSEPEIPRL